MYRDTLALFLYTSVNPLSQLELQLISHETFLSFVATVVIGIFIFSK